VRIVVTAGPTREPIDPVRFISNRSSGKMGYALAEAALENGHDVTLISGPTALTPPPDAEFVSITTSDELFNAVHHHVHDCDMLVMCAAVSDYKPMTFAAQKLEKRAGEFALPLIANARHPRFTPARKSFVLRRRLCCADARSRSKRAPKTAREELRHDRRE
jgi:phosphopantothenoylcysteine decarboxylase/phosphopantothenate--cysteine ligase